MSKQYRIKGKGPDGPLEYFEEELSEAAYLARKMADNGVEDVHVFHEDGTEVDISKAPLPPGWRHGPFKKNPFDQ